MSQERRTNVRHPGPFEGTWDGASGRRECRITDLSVGGCFIDSYASQPVGTPVAAAVTVGGRVFRLESEVVYVDRVQGFAVRFLDTSSEARKALGEALLELKP